MGLLGCGSTDAGLAVLCGEKSPAQTVLRMGGEVQIERHRGVFLRGHAVEPEDTVVGKAGAFDPHPFQPRLPGPRTVKAANILQGQHPALMTGAFESRPFTQPHEK